MQIHAESPPRWPLHQRILMGLSIGAVAGWIAHRVIKDTNLLTRFIDHLTQPIGQLFLNLLLMIVVPLVMSSLILGVAGIGDIRRLGRVGMRSFVYCLVLSSISVVIGLSLANVIQPGRQMSTETTAALQARYGKDAQHRVTEAAAARATATPLQQVVTSIVPRNPLTAISADPPNMLQLMFFALSVGVAITLLPATRVAGLLATLEGVYAVAAKLIDLVMGFAPYAVACLIFNNIALFGLDLVRSLGWFLFCVLFGLALQMFGVYSLAVYWFSRRSPREFFRQIKTVMLTAFSTSSSNATLPTTLRIAEDNLHVPKEIASFVLTVGATANQNGTALYEGVTVLFLAQLAGVDLSLGQQLMVVYLAILGGVGTAGVPAGSIPFIIGILGTIGVEPGLIAVVLGVDRILDMCRTTLNVTGDLTAATYISRLEATSK